MDNTVLLGFSVIMRVIVFLNMSPCTSWYSNGLGVSLKGKAGDKSEIVPVPQVKGKNLKATIDKIRGH